MEKTRLNGILATIGSTPLVELRSLGSGRGISVYAKMEGFNPGGSVKDRTAASLLLGKIKNLELDPSRSVVIESSSGNLAIGLAQICRYFGLRFICVVDTKTPSHNIAVLRAYGAAVEVISEPDSETGEYLPARLRRVEELLNTIPHAYWPNQYANPLNPLAHEETMREIADELGGRVDYLFSATSTMGTLRGCAAYIRRRGLGTTTVAVDAEGSVLFRPSVTGKRLIPGYGASVRPALFTPSAADRITHMTDLDCVVGCRRLAQREAILAGGSSGATVMALEKLRAEIPDGSICVLIFPDRGDRYLDTIYSDSWVVKHFGEVSHLWKDSATAAVDPC
ncbi:MAG TPA: 2,3-diaminopropionate biosynthesis protein SbnA [Streptosporangiaceae bacterium]